MNSPMQFHRTPSAPDQERNRNAECIAYLCAIALPWLWLIARTVYHYLHHA